MFESHYAMCESFPFPEAAARDLIVIVRAVNGQEKRMPDWVTETLKKEFSFDGELSFSKLSYEDGNLFVSETEHADMERFAYILSKVMDEHGIDRAVVLHGVLTCDEDVPGEFIGDTCVVGPDTVRYFEEQDFIKAVQDEIDQKTATVDIAPHG